LREQALHNYLDHMAELMLEKGLQASGPEDVVRDVARARTSMVLRRLDGDRKGVLLRFLQESKLIVKDKAAVSLHEVDLRRADLRSSDLRWTDLRGASLVKANLFKASLLKADLRGADLRGADLTEADLTEADLAGTNLRGANLRESYGLALYQLRSSMGDA